LRDKAQTETWVTPKGQAVDRRMQFFLALKAEALHSADRIFEAVFCGAVLRTNERRSVRDLAKANFVRNNVSVKLSVEEHQCNLLNC